jgi:hypothetical protein
VVRLSKKNRKEKPIKYIYIMENKVIKLLPSAEFKVLRIIKIVGNEWNPFIGYLPYLRDFEPLKYDSQNGDEVDEKMITVLRNCFPNSILWIREEILFNDQLQNTLNTLEGSTRKVITIQFAPLIPFEEVPGLVGRTFYAYPFSFDVRLFLSENSTKKELINDYFICNLPYKNLDEIIMTIKPV